MNTLILKAAVAAAIMMPGATLPAAARGMTACDYEVPAADNTIYTTVETPASFPGGDAEMMKFIAENLRYPKAAASKGIQGRVIVRFVVTKNGEITDVKVIRSKDPDLDAEAMRVVKSMPRFTPARLGNVVVNSYYFVPITFKLPEAD